MISRTGCSRSTPDYDWTGTGLSQQLGQKGHVVVVVCLSITLHHHAPSPGLSWPWRPQIALVRCFSVHVYSVLI